MPPSGGIFNAPNPFCNLSKDIHVFSFNLLLLTTVAKISEDLPGP